MKNDLQIDQMMMTASRMHRSKKRMMHKMLHQTGMQLYHL